MRRTRQNRGKKEKPLSPAKDAADRADYGDGSETTQESRSIPDDVPDNPDIRRRGGAWRKPAARIGRRLFDVQSRRLQRLDRPYDRRPRHRDPGHLRPALGAEAVQGGS